LYYIAATFHEWKFTTENETRKEIPKLAGVACRTYTETRNQSKKLNPPFFSLTEQKFVGALSCFSSTPIFSASALEWTLLTLAGTSD